MTRKAKKGKRKHSKAGLNKSILDVGFGMLRKNLEYKLREAGGFLVEVPTKKVKPSQHCPKCGHIEKKELSERIHQCKQCGYTCDRDFAAAQVCGEYARGLGTDLLKRGSQTSTSSPKERKNCGGWKQVWEKKRKNLTSQLSDGGESENPPSTK